MKKKILLLSLFSVLLLAGCSATKNDDDVYDGMSKVEREKAASDINVELGLAYLERKQLPRAKQKLLQAAQQNPQSPTALDALAYYWEITGDATQAEEYYRRAIKLNPDSGRSLNNYGAYLCRKGDFQQAEKYLLAAANNKNYIGSAGAYENAGLCALRAGENGKATDYFKRALQQDPNRATSYYELADIYYKEKNYNLAKQYLASYQSLTQPDPQSLWLGIQIARQRHDFSTVLKNGAMLEKSFPGSEEYKSYQKMQLS